MKWYPHEKSKGHNFHFRHFSITIKHAPWCSTCRQLLSMYYHDDVKIFDLIVYASSFSIWTEIRAWPFLKHLLTSWSMKCSIVDLHWMLFIVLDHQVPDPPFYDTMLLVLEMYIRQSPPHCWPSYQEWLQGLWKRSGCWNIVCAFWNILHPHPLSL
jgi:hypothetical protein